MTWSNPTLDAYRLILETAAATLDGMHADEADELGMTLEEQEAARSLAIRLMDALPPTEREERPWQAADRGRVVWQHYVTLVLPMFGDDPEPDCTSTGAVVGDVLHFAAALPDDPMPVEHTLGQARWYTVDIAPDCGDAVLPWPKVEGI